MTRPFDSFVVFAEMRTGSNFLEASLNQIPGVSCFGEAFNPHFICYPKWSEALGVTLDQRQRNPHKLLSRIREEPGLSGFRYFHDHDPRVLDDILTDRRCAKIILTRNPLESYVSLKIARKTGQWKLGDAKHRKGAQVAFDADEFNRHLETLQGFQLRLMRGLQVTGQTAFYLDYDDLNEVTVLNGLAAFLGEPDGLTATSRALVKQNPDPIEEKVINPADMAAALTRVYKDLRQKYDSLDNQEHFDLLRTLHFFHEFSHAEIWEVLRASDWHEYKDGEDIVREGEVDDRFYIIVSGKVQVQSNGDTIGALASGECFGETSYVRGAKRQASIRADGQVTILRVSSTLMEQVSSACQLRFNKVFLRSLITRLQGDGGANT